MLRLESVQSSLAQTLIAFVNRTYNTNIRLDRLYIKSIDEVELKGIYIIDHKSDTLLALSELTIELNKIDLSEGLFAFESIQIIEPRFNLKTHSGDTQSNLDIFLASFGESEGSDAKTILTCEQVILSKGSFFLELEDEDYEDYQIDYNHLQVREIFLDAYNLEFEDSRLVSTIKHLEFFNPYFSLSHLQSFLQLDENRAVLKNLHLLTHNTSLNGYFSMDYTKGFSSFTQDVTMRLKTEKSIIGTTDIAAFTEELLGLDRKLGLDGLVEGTVDSLVFKNFGFLSEFDLKLTGTLMNITDPDSMEFQDLDILLSQVPMSLPKYPFHTDSLIYLPEILAKIHNPALHLNVNGNFLKLQSSIKLRSDELEFDALAKLQDVFDENIKLQLEAQVAKLLSEKLLGVPDLTSLVMDLNLDWQGTNLAKANAQGNFNVKELRYADYSYDSLFLNFRLNESVLLSDLIIADKNIQSFLQASLKMDASSMDSEGRLIVKDLRAHELNLIPDYDSLRANFVMNYLVSVKNNQLSVLELSFDTLQLTNSVRQYVDGNMQLSLLSGETDSLHFVSKALDLYLDGDFLNIDPKALVNEVMADMGILEKPLKGEYHNLNAKGTFGKSRNLLGIFSPELYIKEGSSFNFSMNGTERSLSFDFESSKSRYGALVLEGFKTNFSAKNEFSSLQIHSDALVLNDSNRLIQIHLDLNGRADSTSFVLNIDEALETNYSAFLSSNLNFSAQHLHWDIDSGMIAINDSIWSIQSVSEIRFDTSGIAIPLLNASYGNKFLNLSGKMGSRYEDILSINFQSLNLANVDDIFGLPSLNLLGKLSGGAKINAVLGDIQIDSDLAFDDLHVNDQLIGSGEFNANWDKDDQSFKMKGNFHENYRPIVWFNGKYAPLNEEKALDFSLLVRDFKLKSLEPFLVDYISDLEGKINGDLKLSGPLNQPVLYSNMSFHETSFKVNYLGTKYFINKQNVKIRPDWFGFDFIQIKDSKGNTASVTATIFHDNYTQLNYDINLITERFLFLNTGPKDNDMFYGTANLSGDVNLSGFGEELIIEANVETQKDSRIFIPLEGAEEVTESTYIVFVKPDSLQKEEKYQANLDGIQMNLNIDMTDDAEVQLIFDEVAGDIMRAKGAGALQLKINTIGEFNMFGNYQLSEGSYLFTLQSLINKKFELTKGSSITWNGDPLHANLDIKAKYNLRARLSDLLQDESLNSRVNTQVNLFMKEDLKSPDISFGLEFPGLDESIQSRARMAVNSEEQLNRQVFSLLLLNSFSPPEGGLQAGGSAGATSTELLANQLSNWMSHLSDKMQLSVSELNAESFELGLYRGFFDDRVTVEGNVGVNSSEDPTAQEQNTSRLVGDVKVEYKITNDGKLRAKVFNESNDNTLVNQQNAKDTQGVGVFYREEFNSWGEFWRKVFKSKDKKKEAE